MILTSKTFSPLHPQALSTNFFVIKNEHFFCFVFVIFIQDAFFKKLMMDNNTAIACMMLASL